MNLIKRVISRNLSAPKVVGLLLVTNIVYMIMLFYSIPKVMLSSGGMKILDMLPSGYSQDYIRSLFSALGENGRRDYLFGQIPWDMVYPGLFAISYAWLMGYLLYRLGKLDGPWRYLCLLPFIAGTADYLENICIIILLNSYPNLSTSTMSASHLFTIIKSMITTLFFLGFMMVIVLFIVQAFRKKNNEQPIG